jgi:hypothetical protein
VGEARFRVREPDHIDFSDDVLLDKFMSEAAVGAQRLFDDYLSRGFEIGLESVEGDVAREICLRLGDVLDELERRCVNFCPHIDSLPFSRPHVILPAYRSVACLVCAPDHMRQVDPNSSACDLCGLDTKIFYELNLQMGPGVLAMNCGECCISLFKP